jgi:hypothetical protein
LEDDQTASDVTSCVVPSDIVAVALNWDVGLALTDGAVPVTLRDDTVVGEVVELWQAAENPTNATTIASERVHRIMSASRGADAAPAGAAGVPPKSSANRYHSFGLPRRDR